MDLGIKGKRALVLGASRGLGAAIAKSLAAEGAEVIAAARNEGAIADWAKDAEGSITARKLDVSDADAIDRFLDTLLAEGPIDILVNNAGGPPPGKATDPARSDWTAHFETMVANLIHIANRCLPGMEKAGWGRIVTISSSGVEQPIPNLALSNGLRAALVGCRRRSQAKSPPRASRSTSPCRAASTQPVWTSWTQPPPNVSANRWTRLRHSLLPEFLLAAMAARTNSPTS